MRKKCTNIGWGLSLVTLSIILLGNLFGFWFVDIFVDGFWTLFIIVPSILMFVVNKFKMMNLILMIISFGLLVWCWEFSSWQYVLEILLVLLILIIGFKLIISSFVNNKKVVKKEVVSYNGIFASFDEKCVHDIFRGARINSVFGSVSLDLKGIKTNKDVRIKVFSLFGKVKIRVPDNANVEVSGSNVFSVVQNKAQGRNSKLPVIWVDSICIFGEMKIK